jgi:hypothetical protein
MGSMAQDPAKERLALLAENSRLKAALRALLPIAELGQMEMARLAAQAIDVKHREERRGAAVDAEVLIDGAWELVDR